jgi:hypothetical protein
MNLDRLIQASSGRTIAGEEWPSALPSAMDRMAEREIGGGRGGEELAYLLGLPAAEFVDDGDRKVDEDSQRGPGEVVGLGDRAGQAYRRDCQDEAFLDSGPHQGLHIDRSAGGESVNRYGIQDPSADHDACGVVGGRDGNPKSRRTASSASAGGGPPKSSRNCDSARSRSSRDCTAAATYAETLGASPA